MDFYLFRNSKLLHDGGHAVIGFVISVLLILMLGLPAWLGFLLGCTGLAILLESVDTFLGGFLVTAEQRKRILENAKKRGYVPSTDSVKDFANYQIPWVLFFLSGTWPWSQIVGVALGIGLYYVHRQFYNGNWHW